jgi:hypothetical protein
MAIFICSAFGLPSSCSPSVHLQSIYTRTRVGQTQIAPPYMGNLGPRQCPCIESHEHAGSSGMCVAVQCVHKHRASHLPGVSTLSLLKDYHDRTRRHQNTPPGHHTLPIAHGYGIHPSIHPASQPRHSEYPWCSGQGCLMVMRSNVSTANTESTCLTCAQHAAVFGYKTAAAIHAWKHVLNNIHCMWEQGGVYQAENHQLLTCDCHA